MRAAVFTRPGGTGRSRSTRTSDARSRAERDPRKRSRIGAQSRRSVAARGQLSGASRRAGGYPRDGVRRRGRRCRNRGRRVAAGRSRVRDRRRRWKCRVSVTIDAQTVARIPDRLSWTEAAAVPEVFITAHDALFTQAGVQRDERVLIHAVGSGVGLAATQLARACGAMPFGTARTPDKIERAREFGLVDGVVVGDDVERDRAAGNAFTQGRGFEVTLDLLGGAYLGASIRPLPDAGASC